MSFFAPTMRARSAEVSLALLIVALFGVTLLAPRDFWVQDEARYAEVVREMLAGGGWLVPHLNGVTYPDKPPLYFWIVSALSALLGAGELPFRLVSVASTAAAIVGVHRLARQLMGAGSAFWSAAIFASSFLLLLGGHMIRMDMMLTAAAVFAWLAVVRFHASGRGRDLAAFWAFTALALATKGPIALLFTVAPAFVWFGWERRLAGLRSLWPLTGLAALAAGVGAWVWAVVQSGNAEYLDTIWNRQLVGRAINSWSHKEPFYYYLALLPFLLLPWTALVASGARQLHRDRPSYWKPIAVFTIVPFVTLSMVSEKLPIYLLPMMPGVALVAAHAATRLAAQPRAALAYLLAPALFFVLLATGLAWGVWNHAPALRTPGLVLAAVFAAGAVAVVAFGRGDGRRALAVTLGSALATSWLVFGLMSWLANPLFSARELAGALARHAPGDTPVATVRVNRGILNYYAARLYDELDPEETRAWMTAHPNGMVIVKTAEARRVFGAGGVPASCRVHEVYRITFKDYHVIAGC